MKFIDIPATNQRDFISQYSDKTNINPVAVEKDWWVSAVACNDCFKVKDFRKLFVAAWFIYYSTVLGIEHNATPGQSSFLS